MWVWRFCYFGGWRPDSMFGCTFGLSQSRGIQNQIWSAGFQFCLRIGCLIWCLVAPLGHQFPGAFQSESWFRFSLPLFLYGIWRVVTFVGGCLMLGVPLVITPSEVSNQILVYSISKFRCLIYAWRTLVLTVPEFLLGSHGFRVTCVVGCSSAPLGRVPDFHKYASRRCSPRGLVLRMLNTSGRCI